MPDLPEEAVQAAMAHVRAQPLLWQYVSEQDVRHIVEAAAPILAAQVRRDLLAAARACTWCGEIHQKPWGDLDHAYFQASQEAAAWLARQVGDARDAR